MSKRSQANASLSRSSEAKAHAASPDPNEAGRQAAADRVRQRFRGYHFDQLPRWLTAVEFLELMGAGADAICSILKELEWSDGAPHDRRNNREAFLRWLDPTVLIAETRDVERAHIQKAARAENGVAPGFGSGMFFSFGGTPKLSWNEAYGSRAKLKERRLSGGGGGGGRSAWDEPVPSLVFGPSTTSKRSKHAAAVAAAADAAHAVQLPPPHHLDFDAAASPSPGGPAAAPPAAPPAHENINHLEASPGVHAAEDADLDAASDAPSDAPRPPSPEASPPLSPQAPPLSPAVPPMPPGAQPPAQQQQPAQQPPPPQQQQQQQPPPPPPPVDAARLASYEETTVRLRDLLTSRNPNHTSRLKPTADLSGRRHLIERRGALKLAFEEVNWTKPPAEEKGPEMDDFNDAMAAALLNQAKAWGPGAGVTRSLRTALNADELTPADILRMRYSSNLTARKMADVLAELRRTLPQMKKAGKITNIKEVRKHFWGLDTPKPGNFSPRDQEILRDARYWNSGDFLRRTLGSHELNAGGFLDFETHTYGGDPVVLASFSIDGIGLGNDRGFELGFGGVLNMTQHITSPHAAPLLSIGEHKEHPMHLAALLKPIFAGGFADRTTTWRCCGHGCQACAAKIDETDGFHCLPLFVFILCDMKTALMIMGVQSNWIFRTMQPADANAEPKPVKEMSYFRDVSKSFYAAEKLWVEKNDGVPDGRGFWSSNDFELWKEDHPGHIGPCLVPWLDDVRQVWVDVLHANLNMTSMMTEGIVEMACDLDVSGDQGIPRLAAGLREIGLGHHARRLLKALDDDRTKDSKSEKEKNKEGNAFIEAWAGKKKMGELKQLIKDADVSADLTGSKGDLAARAVDLYSAKYGAGEVTEAFFSGAPSQGGGKKKKSRTQIVINKSLKMTGRDCRKMIKYYATVLAKLNANATFISDALAGEIASLSDRIAALQEKLALAEAEMDVAAQDADAADAADDADDEALMGDLAAEGVIARCAALTTQIEALEEDLAAHVKDQSEVDVPGVVERSTRLQDEYAHWDAYAEFQNILISSEKDPEIKAEKQHHFGEKFDAWAELHFKMSTAGTKGLYLFIYKYLYQDDIDWLALHFPSLSPDMLSTERSESANKRVKERMRTLWGFMKGSASWKNSKCKDTFDYIIVDFATRLLFFPDTIAKSRVYAKQLKAAREAAKERAREAEENGAAAAAAVEG